MTKVEAKVAMVTDLLKNTAFHAESENRAIQELRMRDMGQAAMLLDELRYDKGRLQLCVGEEPVEAREAHSLPYDLVEYVHETVEPHTTHHLRNRRDIYLNYWDRYKQPIFGQFLYFSLDSIGKTLRQGGSLTVADRPLPGTDTGEDLAQRA